MELIESTFSGTSDRIKKDEEVQKQLAEQSLHHTEGVEERTSAGQVNKEASNNDPEQIKNGASGISEADDGATPRKVPAVKAEKMYENPLKPPVTPRKNVIPSRRANVDNTRVSASPKRSTLPVDNAQVANLDKHPTTGATPNQTSAASSQSQHQREVLWSEASQSQSKILPDVAGEPARADAANASMLDVPASNQTTGLATGNNQSTTTTSSFSSSQADDLVTHEDLPSPNTSIFTDNLADNPFVGSQEADISPLANLAPVYHDTSAAEAAWHTAPLEDELSKQDTHILASAPQARSEQKQQNDRQSTEEIERRATTAAIETKKMATPVTPLPPVESASLTDVPTTPLPVLAPVKPLELQKNVLTRKRALLLLVLLAIILVNASAAGFNQFFGPQGWGSVWNNHGVSGPNLLTQIAQQLQHSPTPGSKGTPTQPTPTQIVNLLMSNMTLDDKLGQMMMVQFAGQSYSPELDTMISQYHIGSVLYFQFNIGGKAQLTGLNAEMQHNASLPLLVAVDQEGGTVDRLINLDGAQPSASQIGASNNPNLAYQQGLKDARNLTSYGFNLNLAPVVDVNNVYNSQLYGRTYGNNPTTVSQMAEKYLEGLQHSGKVLGTLKHFPGLGDVSTDPHYGLPALTRDLNSLNTIDWAPYSNLIKQGHVYSVMVTHEIVDALDKTEPSSLSPQVIGILRNQMHFQGVIITDSLTMDSIHNFYTYGDAAAKAVEAGDDILMGADSPSTLAQMITGIKQAINSGAITQQHIDDSVRRILLFKYEMGLLHV